MLSDITTPNLGKIKISNYVISYFKEQLGVDDDTKAIEATLFALQSREIERLQVPTAIAQVMMKNRNDPNDLEFWVHQASSTIFLIKPTENVKMVSMALKGNMANFVFN